MPQSISWRHTLVPWLINNLILLSNISPCYPVTLVSVCSAKYLPTYRKWHRCVSVVKCSRYIKTTCVHNFYIIYCCRRYLLLSTANLLLSSLSWYRQLCSVDITMFAQTLTSQIIMPWDRPCCSYKLEIFREYAQICFRSQKISGS